MHLRLQYKGMGCDTWFGVIDGTSCTPRTGTVQDIARHVRQAAHGDRCRSVPAWEEILACGRFRDRKQYLSDLRRLTTFMAREGIDAHLRSPETLLVARVRFLADLDRMIELVDSRIDELKTLEQACMPRDSLPEGPVLAGHPWQDPVTVAGTEEIENLKKLRRTCADQISALAGRVLPNCSALCGNLVAARLLASAGSLERLARRSSSSIQVLGATSALFSHLHGGAPPPKHGILYEHKRVHAAPKKGRGRISRSLAARVAIAARIDYFRGEPDPAFIAASDERVRRRMEGR